MLLPGDVILTGTPGGVGFRRSPQRFLRSGDTVEVEITGVGTLSNPVVDGAQRGDELSLARELQVADRLSRLISG